MRRMLVLLLLCLVAPRVEARAQLVESSGTWEVAERSGARVQLTWRDTSAFSVDFGRGSYGVAYRDHESYVGAAQLESGDVAIFRLTGFGDGEVQVAWRDSWAATSERTEHWVAASGVTTLFDGLPMAAGAEPWPADDPTSTPYEEPRVRLRVDPVMPGIAKEAGVTGTVVLRVLVGRSGGV